MKIESPAFDHGGEIPSRHTHLQGELDMSPPLHFVDVPQNTKSLALIVDDPDAPDPLAPKMTWVHWILYNIPPEITDLSESLPNSYMGNGTQIGENDWKALGYNGPAPPKGRHRYVFKLYALDAMLHNTHSANKAMLEKAMNGHVLEEAHLIGTYMKKNQ